MNALIVSDTHGKLTQKKLDDFLFKRKPDVIFILGDLSEEDIEVLQTFEKTKDVAMYGVIGNHDEIHLLKDHGITDLHLKTVKIGDYTVGGFGGSLKYKNDASYLMYTNEMSEAALKLLAPCDILLTHDKPCFKKFPFFKNMALSAHSGLTGIAEYIKRHKPKYHFHGHIHKKSECKWKDTIIVSCYELGWVTLK